MKVLVVDDSNDDFNLIKEAFEISGSLLKVFRASNGSKALEYLNDNPHPNLILLDINMPIMNGIEFLKEFNENNQLNHIPVVVLTTSSDEGDVYNAYKHGANAFVTKDIDYDKFLESLGSIERFWLNTARIPKKIE
tara:strand:+ start:20553 stop:20960 length:408 start_codon:yes stop_codon:yes gene_type:complete